MHIENENIIDLFYADSNLFDKEGRLQIYVVEQLTNNNNINDENNSNNNRKSNKLFPIQKDLYNHCYCRLRGNLLLYVNFDDLKFEPNGSIDKSPINLIVLNNFAIKPCDQNQKAKNFCEFCLILFGKNRQKLGKYFFACNSTEDRDQWINCIYSNSFSFLKKQTCFKQTLNLDSNDDRLLVDSSNLDSNIRIKIACDNVITSFNLTSPPFLLVKVFHYDNCFEKWKYLGCTEIVQSQNPQFFNCISLPKHYRNHVHIKFELFHVIEKNLEISCMIAYAYFIFKCNHSGCTEKTHQIFLKNAKTNEFAGNLKFEMFDCSLIDKLIFKQQKSFSLNYLTLNTKPVDLRMSSLSSSNLDLTSNNNCCHEFTTDSSSPYRIWNKPICKRFVFSHSNSIEPIILIEHMQDSQFVFSIPLILLRKYVEESESLLHFLQIQSESITDCDFLKKLIEFHSNYIDSLTNISNDIKMFMINNTFRPSKLKKDLFLQLVPINFHKQSCQVCSWNESSSIRIYTVGAYACHHYGFEKYSWKSITQTKNKNEEEYSSIHTTWMILKKLFKVIRIEAEIVSRLKTVIDCLNETVVDSAKIDLLYKNAHKFSQELLDLISTKDEELFLNNMSEGQIYSEQTHLEPIDLIYLNIKACFVDINDKLKRKKLNLNEFEPCNRKLRNAIASLKKIVLACYLSTFFKLKPEEINYFNELKFRHLTIVSQALTTLIIVIMDNLQNESFIESVFKTKTILVMHETLLSCFAEETGMLEDMIYALETLSDDTAIKFSFDHDQSALLPDIYFNSDKIRLVFHVDWKENTRFFSSFADECPDNFIECKILPLIFNIGINQQASMPNNIFKRSLQEELNEANYNKLESHICQFYSNDGEAKRILNRLQKELSRSKNKNIKVLELSNELVRHLNGIKLTCCKSAKDRSGMSVTLEECRFAFKFFKLKQELLPELFQSILDTLRKEGTRIENVYKNIGTRKYAFNYLCLLTFPYEMRPPSGTYSNVET